MALYLGDKKIKLHSGIPTVSDGVSLPTLTNPGLASDLMSGKELIDGAGKKVTGSFTLDSELSDQNALLNELHSVLEGKAIPGGGASVPTCTVRFVDGGGIVHRNFHVYTKCVNGVITCETVDGYDEESGFDITFADVVCGSTIIFPFTAEGFAPNGIGADFSSSAGGGQISRDGNIVESELFRVPTEPDITWVVTLSAY